MRPNRHKGSKTRRFTKEALLSVSFAEGIPSEVSALGFQDRVKGLGAWVLA
jgi:hypothetical protein